jgi:hypothetical protein
MSKSYSLPEQGYLAQIKSSNLKEDSENLISEAKSLISEMIDKQLVEQNIKSDLPQFIQPNDSIEPLVFEQNTKGKVVESIQKNTHTDQILEKNEQDDSTQLIKQGHNQVEQPVQLSNEDFNQYIKSWSDTKLKVDRLVEIEDDLALIIQEVSKSSKLQEMPPKYSNQKVTDFIEAEYEENEQDGAKSPEVVSNVDSKRQYYAAHLGLFLRKDNAKIGWGVLQHRYPKIFNQLTPLVKEIDRSNQVLYSLRVGPFEDFETSNLVCNIFVKYKYRCKPTQFIGDEI